MRATRALLLVLGLTALVVVVTTPSAVARPTAKFTIRSTLDGKRVLPHRITWIAYPSAPVNFPGVEFLIDGNPVFDNRLPPFAFGADGRDEVTKTVRTGYLVTSWLSPGRHEFTVRATSQGADRQTATKTVVATGAGGTGSARRRSQEPGSARCRPRSRRTRAPSTPKPPLPGATRWSSTGVSSSTVAPSGCRPSRAITPPAQEPSPSARRCGHSHPGPKEAACDPWGPEAGVRLVGEWQHADACAGRRRSRRVQQARRDLHRRVDPRGLTTTTTWKGEPCRSFRPH